MREKLFKILFPLRKRNSLEEKSEISVRFKSVRLRRLDETVEC